MRIRVLLVAIASLTLAFAGCSDNEPSGAEDGAPSAWTPSPHAHPSYGYPTMDMLPEAGDAPLPGLPADWYKPDAATLPDTLSGLEGVAQVPGGLSGAGIALFGHYAYVGAWDHDAFWVVDIADPTHPEVVGSVPARTGDADVIAYPDGRLVVVTATRGSNINVLDVTDPTAPTQIATIETTAGNHNLAVLPGTPLVYNAGGAVDIWDLTDPESPVLANVFAAGGDGGRCHDITFHIDTDAALYRAYCAGYAATEIWDVTNATAPEVIVKQPFPSMEQGVPGVGGMLPDQGQAFPLSISHLAMVNDDASILIMGDETGGGAIPGCDAYANAAGMTASGPLGNLWFYDIRDEAAPELLGHLSLNAFEAYGSCTAHFGRVIEDTDHLVMAYYTGGVILVDFTDPENPVITAQWNPRSPADTCTLCGTWDAWYYQGYVFTGDIDRGMDILKVV